MPWGWVWVWTIIWWAVGTVPMLWLRGDNITWGELLICVWLGVLGPFLFLSIAVFMLLEADFWSKPIFHRRRDDSRR